MGYYKNIVVLVQNGTEACGSVKIVVNGGMLQLKLHADVADGDELYLGIADGDGYFETFPLGKSGRLAKTVETGNRLSTTFEPVFALAEVRRGYCEIVALGGTRGDVRLAIMLQNLFERQPYYLPAERKLPEGIQIIGVEIPGIAPAPERAAETAPHPPRAWEEAAEKALFEPAPSPAGGETEITAYASEDALMREDTTVADLLENEAQVESIENYYDKAYEEKRRAERIRRFYPTFEPSAPDYESYRMRLSCGILSKETENTVREVANLLDGSRSEEPTSRFYDTVEAQLSKLFREYDAETYLEKLIEDSRWARVDYDDGRNFYTVGVIYNGEAPAYICYGVPGEYSTVPPPELDGYCEWLPRDLTNPESKGYWMMYQDAVTGESVEVAPR